MTRTTQNLLAFILLMMGLIPATLHAQRLEWVTRLIGTHSASPKAVSIDPWGNVVTVGEYVDTIDVDPGPGVTILPNSTSFGQTYIQKLDPNGNFIWGKSLNSLAGTNTPRDVTIDAAGNIYLAGFTSLSVDLDPGAGIDSVGAYPGGTFFLRLDPAGNYLRGGYVQSAEIMYQSGSIIALDNFANIYIAGTLYAPIDLDMGPGTYPLTHNGYQDAFIAKYDSSLALQWAVQLSSSGQELAFSLSANASGCFVTGRLNNPTDMDPGPGTTILNNGTSVTGYIAHYDPQGALVWAGGIGGGAADVSVFGVAVDSLGDVTIGGSFTAPIDLDPTPGTFIAPHVYGSDIFAVKLDSSGGFKWAATAGSNAIDGARNLTVDAAGNVYLSTFFHDTIDFDPGPGVTQLTNNPSNIWDDALWKLDSQGNFEWVAEIGGSSYEFLTDAAVDAANDVYCVGSFQSTVDFAPFPYDSLFLTAIGFYDGFTVKWAQDSCTSLSVSFDSIGVISCLGQSAHIEGHAAHGLLPYAYAWNTLPPTMDSIAHPNSPGPYTLMVTDARGCTSARSVWVTGYTHPNAFDLQVNLVAGAFREAVITQLVLDAFNAGCTPVSGQAKLVLDPQVIFQSAFPTPNAIIGDTLFWTLPSMNFDNGHFVAHVQVVTDTSVALGDSLDFAAIVTPAVGDAQPLNNTRLDYVFPVLMSLDPNLIDVYPPGACENRYVLRNEPLTYTVHFQNTGNAEALEVMVEDSLDPNLDPSTLSIKGSSHSMITEMLPGGVVRFIFNDLHLPDSASNPSGSQGYVIFELLPVSNIPSGTVISAQVGIFFDFNPAVITNTVTNTLVDVIPPCAVVSLPGQEPPSLTIAPNPASSTAILSSNAPLIGVTVYNLLGQTIYANPAVQDQQLQLDLQGWPKGIYLLQTAASSQCLRLVVE